MKNRSAALMDRNVTLTMIVFIVMAAIVLAFRYKRYEPCSSVNILVKEGKINTGELLRFTAEAKDISKKELVWDFGDKSMQKANGSVVTHTYTAPGKYDITLAINGKCREYKTIYIDKETSLPQPVTFRCPLTAKVGEVVRFKDFTPDATSWEWRFGETNKVDAIIRQPGYAFKSPGRKTVLLVVNGNMQGYRTVDVRMNFTKGIGPQTGIRRRMGPYVPDVPGTGILNEQLGIGKEVPETIGPPEEIIKAPEISNGKMEDMLRQVVNGSKEASAFSEYLCGNLNMIVNYNGRRIPFSQMCGELKGEMRKLNKIKTLQVATDKDPVTNCIKYMTVQSKKKWL